MTTKRQYVEGLLRHCFASCDWRGLATDHPVIAGAQDVNDCERSPCAANALCVDGINNFTCACPPGFVGDPYNMYGACKGKHIACISP